MSKKSLNKKLGINIYNELVLNIKRLPFSFCYNGSKYESATKSKIIKEENDKVIINKIIYQIGNTLEVTYVATLNKEFSQIEYYAYIKNISNKISSPITNLISLDIALEGEDPVVRGNYGDLGKYYEAYENHLNHGDMRFKQADGRACHIMFPYFDLCYGNKGILFALGWAGTWECLFTTSNNKTNVIAKNCLDINTCLLPQESIRTALIVIVPYKGRNEDNATNLWREWYIKYNMPKNIKPFTACMLANDTGVANLDGSVSETYLTYKPSIDILKEEGLLTNYRWIDAGWYIKPDKTSSKDDWWGSVGAYDIDTFKWPENTFKEAIEYCHKLNMKTFLWFEPERVSNIEALVNNYNYQKEWAFETPHAFYNNIGNKDCFNWTINRIISILDKNNVDMYREDNNQTPGIAWEIIDKFEEKQLNIQRKGINENKCVLAHYNLLKTIVDYQIKNNKENFVDICAGGGGRNDIESLRYGIPMMRSDVDRGTSSMRLSQTSTLIKWVVFHGSSCKETDSSYKLLETKGATPYVARASYLPIFHLNEAFIHNKNLDYDRIRNNLKEWQSINHLLTKDFYRLTPFRHNTNKTSWTIFSYAYKNESIILGFRMEDCKDESYTVKLPYVSKNKDYEILNVDTNELLTYKGNDLLNKGITLKLANPKTSILLKLKKK